VAREEGKDLTIETPPAWSDPEIPGRKPGRRHFPAIGSFQAMEYHSLL
jgi:hypothetical protein